MTLPPPDDPRVPRYWMYEQGGQLAPAVRRFLAGVPLSPRDILLIRAYLVQWIGAEVWMMNPAMTRESRKAIEGLRSRAAALFSESAIRRWIFDALEVGIDPL
jgi:hypothetical protein